MGNDTESYVFSPDVLGESIVLMGPWYGGIDRITVHFQPFTHPPKALLKNGHDASVMGRADIHQQVATAAVRTHVKYNTGHSYRSKILNKKRSSETRQNHNSWTISNPFTFQNSAARAGMVCQVKKVRYWGTIIFNCSIH